MPPIQSTRRMLKRCAPTFSAPNNTLVPDRESLGLHSPLKSRIGVGMQENVVRKMLDA